MQPFHLQLQDSLNTSSVSTHQPPAAAAAQLLPSVQSNNGNNEAVATAAAATTSTVNNNGPSHIAVIGVEASFAQPPPPAQQQLQMGDVMHTSAVMHAHMAGGRRTSEAAAAPETAAMTNAAETGWKEVQRQQIIDHANELLKFCAIKKVVTSIRQCTSSFFVLLYQRLFDCTISGIDRAPNTPEKKLQNVSLVLEELRKRNYDLRNISVEEVVRLNEDHISRLVLVFVQIATAMYTAQQRRLQGGHVASEGNEASAGATAAALPSRGYTVAEITPPPPPPVTGAALPSAPAAGNAAQNVYDAHATQLQQQQQQQAVSNITASFAETHGVTPHHAATDLYDGAQGAQAAHMPYAGAPHAEHANTHLMGHNNNANTTATAGAVYAMGASPSEYARYHAHHAARHHDIAAAAAANESGVVSAAGEGNDGHRYYYYYSGNEHPGMPSAGERVPPQQPLSRSPDEGNTDITSGYGDEEGENENEYEQSHGSVIPTDVLVKNWYRTIVFPPVSPDSQPRPPQPHRRAATHPSQYSTATTTTSSAATSASARAGAAAATETSSARPASEANVEASHPRARRGSAPRSPAAADHASAERVAGHRGHGPEMTSAAGHTAGQVPGLLSTPQQSPPSRPKPRSSFADEVQELQRRQRSLNEALQRRPREAERPQGKRKPVVAAAMATPSRVHHQPQHRARPAAVVTPDARRQQPRREPRTPQSWAAEQATREAAGTRSTHAPPYAAEDEKEVREEEHASVAPQGEVAGRGAAMRHWHQRPAGPLVEAPLTRVECRLLASHPQRQIDAAVRDRKIERLRAARFLGDAQSRLRQRMRQQYDESMAAMRERLRQSLAIAAQSKHDHMRRMRDENDKYRRAYATLMQAAVNDVRVPTHMMSRHTMNLAEYYAASLEESRRMCRYLEKEQERRNKADLIDYAQSVSAWQQQVLV